MEVSSFSENQYKCQANLECQTSLQQHTTARIQCIQPGDEASMIRSLSAALTQYIEASKLWLSKTVEICKGSTRQCVVTRKIIKSPATKPTRQKPFLLSQLRSPTVLQSQTSCIDIIPSQPRTHFVIKCTQLFSLQNWTSFIQQL